MRLQLLHFLLDGLDLRLQRRIRVASEYEVAAVRADREVAISRQRCNPPNFIEKLCREVGAPGEFRLSVRRIAATARGASPTASQPRAAMTFPKPPVTPSGSALSTESKRVSSARASGRCVITASCRSSRDSIAVADLGVSAGVGLEHDRPQDIRHLRERLGITPPRMVFRRGGQIAHGANPPARA